MKVFLALFLAMVTMSCGAMAQERQTYTNSDISFAGNPIAQQRAQLLMQPLPPRHYRYYRSPVPVAPVRYRQERFYDRLPYYPGDYRDAVDRGEWAAGDAGPAPYTQQ